MPGQARKLIVTAAITMIAIKKLATANIPALAMLKRYVEVSRLCRSTKQVFTLYFSCLYDSHGETYFIKT